MSGVPVSLKLATARLTVLGRDGTGYLVAPRRIATSQRCVEAASQATVTMAGKTFVATVVGEDREGDVAILGFEESVAAQPLALATSIDGNAEFTGFGFSSEAGHPSRSFDGIILKAVAQDDEGRSVIQVFSDPIQRGETLPRGGFRGSPLWVDGAVIGHLTSELGENGDPGGYGVAYAASTQAIRKLLDVEPEVKAVALPEVSGETPSIEELPQGHYHVFISYRSTDREFASSLRERLEGAGLRAFLDQTELEPGDPLAESLQRAIENSRNAVVLVSQSWLESRWCQKEASVLLQRSVEQDGFTLVPVRLDESKLPAFLGELLWVDFNGRKRAEGPEVDRLVRALVARSGAKEAVPSRIRVAETRVLDAFLGKLRAAEKVGWKAVMAILADWRRYDAEDKTPLLHGAELLIGLNRPTNALEVLERAGNGLRALQLRAVALDKRGEWDKAIFLLEPLYNAEHRNAETGGILAGIYKRRALDQGNRASLREAYELYLETWAQTKDTYNGINASALALQLGDRPGSRKLAAEVLAALEEQDEKAFTHWNLATVGEAHLLNENLDEARIWYGKAVARKPDRIQDIGIMRTQVRLNLKGLGLELDKLDDVFPLPTVLAFAGHMVDAPGRVPRFPETREGDVRIAIRKRLEKLGKVYAYCGAARGSDLIFLEELLERGGSAKVILPFREEDFKKTSVGQGWNSRFDKIVKKERVELIAPPEDAPEDLRDLQASFAATNKAIYAEASEFAKGLDQEPRMLAVWDGKDKGYGPGGTADAIQFWKAQGKKHTVDVIDVYNPLKEGVSKTTEERRRIRAKAGLALSGAGLTVAALVMLAWNTNLFIDTRQITLAEEVSEQVRVSESFDASQSAGLFVGVRAFSRDRISEVPFAVDDAVDLAYLFAMELKLIEPKNVVLALSGEPQKWTSKKRLSELLENEAVRRTATFTDVIDEIGRVSSKVGKDGILVASVATHGFNDQGLDYLVASDSVRARVVTTGVPVSVLFDDVSTAKAPRKLLLLDACREPISNDTRNMSPSRAAPQSVMSAELAQAISSASGMAVLSGTTKGGFSYDDREEKNGVFTNAIIEGLGGNAAAVDGFITIETLASYAQKKVLSWVEKNRPEHRDVSRGISYTIDGGAATMPLAHALP